MNRHHPDVNRFGNLLGVEQKEEETTSSPFSPDGANFDRDNGGLTQQDCVVWDESHNVDLRRVTSPAYHSPTMTPSTRASSATASTASSSNAIAAAPSSLRHRHPRESSLESVTKCLTERIPREDGEEERREGSSSSSLGASELEVDRIFNKLEREDGSSGSAEEFSGSGNLSANHRLRSHLLAGRQVTGSRKRHRQQRSQRLHGESDKENAKNARLPAIRAVHRRRLQKDDPSCQSVGAVTATPAAAPDHVDPFGALLREIESQPGHPPPDPEATHCDEGSSSGPCHQREGTQPLTPTRPSASALPQPGDGTASFDLAPSTTAPHPTVSNAPASSATHPPPPGGVDDDPFGDVEFSLEDLAFIDAMVEQATQPSREECDTAVAAPESCRYGLTGGSPPHPARPEEQEDPFGDSSLEWDFVALDRSIVECQKLGAPASAAAACVALNPPSCSRVDHLTFSRYRVIRVHDDAATFTKMLQVQAWRSDTTDAGSGSSRGHARKIWNNRPSGSLGPVDGEVHLCGDWYHTPLRERDVVHVCSLASRHRTDAEALPLVLDTRRDDDLLLVVHPDMLLTPTTVAEAVTCSRRAVLKNLLGSTGLSSKAAIFGTMRHSLFEEMMRARDFSLKGARQFCDAIVRRNAETLVACCITAREAELELLKVVPQIERFANEFTAFGAHSTLSSASPNLEPIAGHSTPFVRFLARDVDAIEELIVSPELGLKGNIDMVVEAHTTNTVSSTSRQSLMSVELKTGHHQRTQHAHTAQLALYALLLNARCGTTRDGGEPAAADIEGVLLYLNGESLKAAHVTPNMFEVKALVGNRNLVALETRRSQQPRGVVLKYQNDCASNRETSNNAPEVDLLEPSPSALPDVLNNTYPCERCYVNRECMLHAATSETHDMNAPADSIRRTHKDLMQRFTGHLRPEDLAFFTKWNRLVDLEADSELQHCSEAWLIGSVERERATQKCMSSLCFDPSGSATPLTWSGDSSHAVISLQRSSQSDLRTPLSNLSFEPGCQVILSTDNTSIAPPSKPYRSQMHIVRGLFLRASEIRAEVRAGRDDLSRLFKFIQRSNVPGEKLLFRLDRDEVATGIGTLRQNLVTFMTRDALEESNPANSLVYRNRLSRLRDIVVRLREPVYDESLKQSMFNPPQGIPSVPGCDLMDLVLEFAELNADQQAAAEKVMMARDFTMIQGLPGTGKTSTIAFVTRLLVAHGKRVLITSYTNAAVDNVLLKLMGSGLAATGPSRPTPAVLRVGRDESTHCEVKAILASSAALAFEKSVKEGDAHPELPSPDCLRRCVKAARVVGVTALSVPRSPLLVDERFDVVIVDEAGQITQPAAIGALMAADSFVLVGDHEQLPPLVTSELAEMGGLADSLLKLLAEAHPNDVARLSLQYRMNREICMLSNEIVYNGALRCANQAVAGRSLHLSAFPNSQIPKDSKHWLFMAVCPEHPVVFIDTDCTSSSHESLGDFLALERMTGRGDGGSVVNDTEATIVRNVVARFLSCGMKASKLGVVCPFRAQLRLLNEQCDLREWKSQGLEVSTIDRYQGRDKDAIVLSFVRSNSKGKVGRLLEDFRRLNVATTRAKCKLVMVGSFRTLVAGSPQLRCSLQRLQTEGKVISYRKATAG